MACFKCSTWSPLGELGNIGYSMNCTNTNIEYATSRIRKAIFVFLNRMTKSCFPLCLNVTKAIPTADMAIVKRRPCVAGTPVVKKAMRSKETMDIEMPRLMPMMSIHSLSPLRMSFATKKPGRSIKARNSPYSNNEGSHFSRRLAKT